MRPASFPALFALLISALALQAGEFAVLKVEIQTARKALVTLALYRGKQGPDQQKVVKDTADAVSAHLARLKAPAGKAAAFEELKTTWADFKATREKELVPAILAGEREKADKIGTVIQKARLDRMYALLDDLDK
jgi:hypothetical protein